MARLSPLWSDNEVRRLRTMIAAGALAPDIAQALGRSTHGVVKKARKMGLPLGFGSRSKAVWRCGYCYRQPPRVRRINSGAHVCRRCRDDLAARGLRWCCGCHTPKPVEVIDHHARCPACMLARSRSAKVRSDGIRWRERNKERVQAYRRDFLARRNAMDPDYDHRRYLRKKAKDFQRIWSGARPQTDDA